MLASFFHFRLFSVAADRMSAPARRMLWLAVIALLLCPVSSSAPCDTSWTGSVSVNWNVAGNWSSGVPTSSTNSCISAANSAVTLNIFGAATANLTLGLSTDSLSFANGTELTVSGSTISNAGAISMNSTGNFTELQIGAANVTLSGAGTLTLGNSAENVIFGTAGANVLANQSTIQGSGNIGDGQMALNNSGTIDANQSTNLILQITNGATNTGLLEATNNATLVVQGGTYTNTGGTIQAAPGSTVQFINGATINGGTITQTGGTIYFPTFSSSTIGAEILNPANSGQVKLDNGAVVTLGAGSSISNAGTITMNSAGNATELLIGTANVTLSGTGTFTMSNNANNLIFGTSGLNVLTNQSTIQGSGNIGDGQMGLNNSGTIDANQSVPLILQITTGATNTGTLEATNGGTLILNGGTYTNTGGTITNNASTLEFEGNATINGGTVSQTGAGTLKLSNGIINTTLTNSTTGTVEVVGFTNNTIGGTLINPTGGQVTVDNGGVLILGSGSSISNAGTMTINSTVNATELQIGAASVTLSGAGTLTLSNSAQNFIFGTAGANVLANQSTIQGSGNIGDGQMALNNSGTIDANQPTNLILQITNGATNTGMLEATNNATLVVEGGTYTNTGGTIQAAPGSTVQFINAATINGGTITQTGGTIDFPSFSTSTIGAEILNPANAGQVKIDNGAAVTLGVGSSISNAGTITMNSMGNVTELLIGTANVTLSGAGTFTMSNNLENFIFGTASANQLTNQSTIQGAGNIGDGQMALNNSGTIDANQSNALTLQISNGATNTGTLEATSGGTLIFNGGTYTNTGGIITNNASTVELENSATINGGTVSQTGAGTLKLAGGTINTAVTNSTTGTVEVVTSTNNTIAGTLNNPAGGQVKIDNASVLTMGAGSSFSNAGAITMNSTVNVTELLIGAANVTLSGTGTLTLSNSAENFIFGALSTNQLTNQSTIQGAGNIGDGTMALNNSTTGTIDANQSTPLILQISNGATNTGKLEATAGGTLTFQGGTYTNTGGTILATGANSKVLLESGVTITGGTLTSTSGGVFMDNATATLSGLTISAGTVDVLNGSVLNLQGTITNKGTINLQSSANVTELNIGSGPVTLAGTGKVILSANTNNFILGTGTLTNQNTIEGEGNIGDGEMGLVNSGSILANETGANTPSILYIDTGAAGFTNNNGAVNGTVNASAKNTLIIEGGAFTNMNTTTGTLTGGIYDATGTLEFAAGTSGIVTNDATISLTSATGAILNTSESNASALSGFTTNGTTGSFSVTTQKFTDTNTFTNQGTLIAGSGGTLDFSTGLTNFNSGTNTLTGGTYNVTGTLEFPGANIVVNNANITLTGTTPKILNSTNSANALALFNDNKGTFTVNGGTFTDTNSFTNTGTLAAGAKGLFNASGGLTNFNSGTLTGGSYTLTTTGQIQFNNEGFANDIVTNDAKITLAGVDTTVSPFIDQTGGNALANFAANGSTGSLLLTTDRNFTTPGSFSNAGTVSIGVASGTGKTQLTIGAGGNYTQTAGMTTVDSLLTTTGSGAINLQGGFLYGNKGTLTGAVDVTGGTLNPGDGLNKIGVLTVDGSYTESGTGILNIDLDGTVAQTKYDVLDVAGVANLGGTINIDLVSGFKPVVGTVWDVLNYTSETGSFANVNLPTAPTGDHYVFTCGATDCTLTLDAGPSPAAKGTVSGAPATRVSRNMGAVTSASTHEPVAILSQATCFAARLFGSASCGKESGASVATGGEMHATSAGGGAVHNNIMVATRSISAARGGASRESSASAAAMARLYVCAYLPASVGHTMGCN